MRREVFQVSSTSTSEIALCEVVVAHDVRSRRIIPGRQMLHRYYLRRSVSIAVLMTIDLVAVLAATELAPLLWAVAGVTVETPTSSEMLWSMLIVVGVEALGRMYSLRQQRACLSAFLRANLAILLVLGLVMLLTHNTITAQSAVCIWTLFVLLSGAGRWLYNWVMKDVCGHTTPRRPTVIIGRRSRAERLAELLAHYPAADAFRIDGIVEGLNKNARTWDDTLNPAQSGTRRRPLLVGDERRPARALRNLGSLDDLENIVERWRPVEIVICDPELVRGRMPQLMNICRRRRITLRMAIPGLELDGASVSFAPGFGMPVFLVRTSIGRPYEYEMKRLFDIVISGLLLLVLSPLLAAIAVAIKLSSPGPVLYRSIRVGLGQAPFHCLKFRTMHENADELLPLLEHKNEAAGALFKIKERQRSNGRLAHASSRGFAGTHWAMASKRPVGHALRHHDRVGLSLHRALDIPRRSRHPYSHGRRGTLRSRRLLTALLAPRLSIRPSCAAG